MFTFYLVEPPMIGTAVAVPTGLTMMLKSQQNTVQLSTANKKVTREKQVFIQTKWNSKNKISKKYKRREKLFQIFLCVTVRRRRRTCQGICCVCRLELMEQTHIGQLTHRVEWHAAGVSSLISFWLIPYIFCEQSARSLSAFHFSCPFFCRKREIALSANQLSCARI